MRRRKQYLLVMSVLSVAGVMVILFLTQELQARRDLQFLVEEPHQDALPALGTVSEFELTSAAEETPFALENLKGKVSVVDFIFTSCGGICPVMTNNLSDVHRMFSEEEDVQFVSVSVDPETDTPEVLREYAKRNRANPERWYFLTGDLEAIHTLAVDGFKIGSVDDPLIHSPHFVLVDRAGKIRGYYTGTDPEEKARIADDIRTLLAEPVAVPSP